MKKIRNIVIASLLVFALCFVAQPVFAQGKINLNTATVEQLVALKGIGEAKAQKIIDYRTKHEFTSVNQLVEVKGIGDKLLEKLRDQLTVKTKKKK